MKYLIQVNVTVTADNEVEARALIGTMLTNYMVLDREDRFEDFSIEDTLESYGDDGQITLFGDMTDFIPSDGKENE